MIKLEERRRIDRFDEKMMQILSTDGRIAITDLAKKLGMSKTPCGVRLKRLMSDGYITGFKAVLNPVKLDMNHVAFVEVRLQDTKEAALKAFNESVQLIPEIEQCHMIAGSFDYLLKVRTKDIIAYRRVLAERISDLPHVASTSTYVAVSYTHLTLPTICSV